MPLTLSKQSSLWLLVLSQFAGTSLWFVGNAVIDSLPMVSANSYASLTSAVQIGFIAGTLVFSVFGFADRYSSPVVFFFSALAAAAANVMIIPLANHFAFVLILRFVTGFFLAGIYPVGMKIAADFFPQGLGKALGFLVGALVFGTAFPHLVRSQSAGLGWKGIITASSLLAVGGGLLVLVSFPKKKKANASSTFHLFTALKAFCSPPFLSAALGYFGHMWELYALWAVLPVLFKAYDASSTATSVYFWSFLVIAAGSVGCVLGGLVSQKWGSKKVAFYSLLLSGISSLLAPLLFAQKTFMFLVLMLFWGITVTADSPQFSALVARFAEPKTKGTALTLVTCFGFSITVISILLLKQLFSRYGVYSLWVLSLGPLLGLIALKRPDTI